MLGSAGESIASSKIGNIITTMQKTEDGFYLGCIGHFFPKEDRKSAGDLSEAHRAGFGASCPVQ